MSWRKTRDYLERAHLAAHRREPIPMAPAHVESRIEVARAVFDTFTFRSPEDAATAWGAIEERLALEEAEVMP